MKAHTIHELRTLAETLERVAYGLSDPARGGAMTMSAYVAADAISRATRDIRIIARKGEEENERQARKELE